jgi:hypothetical protein
MRDIINTMKENREVLIDASKEVVLESTTEKIKYILMFHNQNANHDHNINTTNR